MDLDSFKAAAATAALLFAAPVGVEDNLSLRCDGAMRGMFKDRSGGALLTDNKGNVITGGGSTSRYSDIQTVAHLELSEGKARLNLPQPPTCGICVGEKGWRNVKELSVTSERITGKITYGLFSATRFEVDRRTGVMTSENGFRGTCEAQDLSVRKF